MPGLLCRIDLKQAEPEATLFRRIELKGLNADDFETAQHFVSSRDGTRVPMFIVQKKGTERDGNNPTLLYGYGGVSVITLWTCPKQTAVVSVPMSDAICDAQSRRIFLRPSHFDLFSVGILPASLVCYLHNDQKSP